MRNRVQHILASVVLAFGLMIIPAAAGAQTIGQTTSSSAFGNSGQGQSFKATVTGTVTQIAVRPNNNFANDTLRFYSGSSGSGTTSAPGVAAYTQTVSTVAAINDASALQTITLTTPFPVVAGNTYTFVFAGTRLRISSTSLYADGTWIYDYAVAYPTGDAAFQVVQQVAAAPVPTLSEWAMILFGTILAGGAALYIQRRRLIA